MKIKLIRINKNNFPKFKPLIVKNLELVFLICTTLTVIILDKGYFLLSCLNLNLNLFFAFKQK